jgi:hypothetical protein
MESRKSTNSSDNSDGVTELLYSPTSEELELNFSIENYGSENYDSIASPKINDSLTEEDFDWEFFDDNNGGLTASQAANLHDRVWNGTRIGPPTLEEVQMKSVWLETYGWDVLNFGFAFAELEGVSFKMQDAFTPAFKRSTKLVNVAGKFDGQCQNYRPGHVIKSVSNEALLSSLSY